MSVYDWFIITRLISLALSIVIIGLFILLIFVINKVCGSKNDDD